MADLNFTVSDPVTSITVASLNALTEWFRYLQTPAGQQYSVAQQARFEKFTAFIEKVVDKS